MDTVSEAHQNNQAKAFEDIGLWLNFSNGIFDEAIAEMVREGVIEEESIRWMFTPESIPSGTTDTSHRGGQNCERESFGKSSIYEDLRSIWSVQSHYLATTEPIPGLLAEKRFIVPRNIWPQG
ncbi:MAG: hypothetical protein OXC62_15775 [Aestuariivita sp.]|nr:hypothetical protein [Aestuariivita sp.]